MLKILERTAGGVNSSNLKGLWFRSRLGDGKSSAGHLRVSVVSVPGGPKWILASEVPHDESEIKFDVVISCVILCSSTTIDTFIKWAGSMQKQAFLKNSEIICKRANLS